MIKRQRDKPINRLFTLEDTLLVTRGELGRGRGIQGMEIKEDTCPDEHCVMCESVKSLYCTLKLMLHCMLMSLE